jgi:Terpene cyclase DEP1
VCTQAANAPRAQHVILCPMTPLRIAYLVLALVGAVWPWTFNLAFMAAHPGTFDVALFVREAFSTPAGGSLSADILIVALAGSVWMIVEARRLKMRFVWAYLVYGTLIAFASALPLFLFMREGVLERDERR